MKLGFLSVCHIFGIIIQIDLNHGRPDHIHGLSPETDSSKNVICVGSPIIGSTRANQLIQLRRFPDVHPNEKNTVICVQSQVLESNLQFVINELLGIQKVLDAKASGQLERSNLEKKETLEMVANLFNNDCVKSVLNRLIAVRNKLHENHSDQLGGPYLETGYPLKNMEDLFNNDYVQTALNQLHTVKRVLDSKMTGQQYAPNFQMTDRPPSGALQNVEDLFNNDYGAFNQEFNSSVENAINQLPPSCGQASDQQVELNIDTGNPKRPLADDTEASNQQVEITMDTDNPKPHIADDTEVSDQQVQIDIDTGDPKRHMEDLFALIYNQLLELRTLLVAKEQQNHNPEPGFFNSLQFVDDQLLEMWRALEGLALDKLQENNSEPTDMTEHIADLLQIVYDQLHKVYGEIEATTPEQQRGLDQLPVNSPETMDTIRSIWKPFTIIYDKLYEAFMILDPKGPNRQQLPKSPPTVAIQNISDVFKHVNDRLSKVWNILEAKDQDQPAGGNFETNNTLQSLEDLFKKDYDQLSDFWKVFEAKKYCELGGCDLESTDTLQMLVNLLKKDYEQLSEAWRLLDENRSCEPGSIDSEGIEKLQDISDSLNIDYDQLLNLWDVLQTQGQSEPPSPLQDITSAFKNNFDLLIDTDAQKSGPQKGNLLSPQNGNLFNPQQGNPLGPQIGNLLSPQNGNLFNPQKGNLFDPQQGNPLGPQKGNLFGSQIGNLLSPQNGNLFDPQKGNLLGPQIGNLLDPQIGNLLESSKNSQNIPDILTNVYDQLPAVCKMLESKEPNQAAIYNSEALNPLLTQLQTIWRIVEANIQHYLQENDLTLTEIIRNFVNLIKTVYDRLPEVWKILGSKAAKQVIAPNLETDDWSNSPESLLPESLTTIKPDAETSGSSVDVVYEGSDDDDMPTTPPAPPAKKQDVETSGSSVDVVYEGSDDDDLPTTSPAPPAKKQGTNTDVETSGSSVDVVYEGDDDDMPPTTPAPPVEEEEKQEEGTNTEWTDTLHMISFLFKIDYDQLRAVWTVLEQKAPEQLDADGSETTGMLQTIAKLFTIDYDQLLVVWRVLQTMSPQGSNLDTNETLHMIANVVKMDYEELVEGGDALPPIEDVGEIETNPELIEKLHMVAFLFKIDYEKLHSMWKVIEAKVPEELKGDRSQVAANLRMIAKMFKINYEQLLAVWRVLETKAPEGTISETTHSLHMIAELFKISYDDLLEVWRVLDAMQTFEEQLTDADMTERLKTIAGLFEIDYDKLLEVWSVLQSEAQKEELKPETNGTIGIIDELFNIEAELITDIPPEEMFGPPRSIPYRAVIFAADGYVFIGSLVSLNSVLTSAYSVKYSRTWDVGLGSVAYTNDSNEYEYYERSDVGIPHPYYDSELHLNDIAIIKLPKPVTLSININLINLPTFADIKVNIAHKEVIVICAQSLVVHNTIVNATIVHTISNSECAEVASQELVTNSILCTMARSDSQPQINENGDPLVLPKDDGTFTLVGILSSEEPPVAYGNHRFTRVTSFLGWLEEVSDINVKC